MKRESRDSIATGCMNKATYCDSIANDYLNKATRCDSIANGYLNNVKGRDYIATYSDSIAADLHCTPHGFHNID